MSYNIIRPSPDKSVAPGEKVEKASGNLEDIKAPVVMIRQNDLYNKRVKENTKKINFQGKSTISKRWSDIDHYCLEKSFVHVNPSSLKTL